MASLSISVGGVVVLRRRLDGPVVMGRGPGAGLQVGEQSVSRMHCRFEPLEGGRCRVVDLGSLNGLIVRGARVESVVLGAGEVVQVGAMSVRLHDGNAGDDEQTRTRPLAEVRAGLDAGGGSEPGAAGQYASGNWGEHPDVQKLGPRLRGVFELLIASPLARKGMAAELGLKQTTVSGYVKEVYRRLGVGSRQELTMKFGGRLPPGGFEEEGED